MKKILIAITILLLFSCTHKSTITIENTPYEGFSSKAEYERAFEKFDYFQYRYYLIWNGIKEQNFEGIHTIIDQGKLVGNQLDEDYMQAIKTIIFLKNNKTFGNDDLDKQYSKMYNWFKPRQIEINDEKEKNIITQIDMYLDPRVETVNISKLNDYIIGIWQVNTWDIYDGYLQSIRFSDNQFEIRKNEMANSERFQKIVGTYEINKNNIILHPKTTESFEGGEYFDGDNDGLIQDFIGGKKNIKEFPLDSVIVYPVLKLQKMVDMPNIFRFEIVTDKPHYYYRIRQKVE